MVAKKYLCVWAACDCRAHARPLSNIWKPALTFSTKLRTDLIVTSCVALRYRRESRMRPWRKHSELMEKLIHRCRLK